MGIRITSILKVAAIAVAPFVILALDVTEAQAWYCKATSPTGSWGWGRSGYRGQAVSIALNECAIRTPRGYVCRLRYCS